jgi:hypothetical protein
VEKTPPFRKSGARDITQGSDIFEKNFRIKKIPALMTWGRELFEDS